MRHVLSLGLLIALVASADAATAHYRTRHHVLIPPGVSSSFASAPGWSYGMPRQPIPYGDTPSYNDPSRFGGNEALPIGR
jgi:hypothetical protein